MTNQRIEVPAAAAASGWTSSLAEPLGSRARAQRLIDAGLVSVDGAVVPKRHRLVSGEVIEVEPEPVPPAVAVEDVPYEIVFEDEHLLVVDKPAGVVVHPARVMPPARSRRHWRAGRRAARCPSGPDRAPARPRHLGAARGGALRRRAQGAPGPDPLPGARARVPGTRGGPAARTVRHDRCAAGPRPPRAHEDVLGHRRPPRGAHALHGRARAADVDAAARAPGDRPHAPDPRAPAGHRHTRSRATRCTGPPACSASSASSSTPHGSRSTIRSLASGWTSPRRCPPISRRHCGRRRPLSSDFVHCGVNRSTTPAGHPAHGPCPAQEAGSARRPPGAVPTHTTKGASPWLR